MNYYDIMFTFVIHVERMPCNEMNFCAKLSEKLNLVMSVWLWLPQGITTNVTLSGNTLEGWTMTPLPITNTSRLGRALTRLRHKAAADRLPPHRLQGTDKGGMTFYTGSFEVLQDSPHPMDTFLRLDGWTKVRLQFHSCLHSTCECSRCSLSCHKLHLSYSIYILILCK